MDLTRRSLVIYAALAAIWVLIAGWQTEEHLRVREGAKSELSNRSKDIANTVSACIRGMRFRGTVLQERLEPLLNELVNARSNELVKSSEVISLALLNATGEPIAQAGRPIDFESKDILQKGERWGQHTVTFVNPVDLGASLTSEGTNYTVVLPPMRDMTNGPPREGQHSRGFGPPPDENHPSPPPDFTNRPAAPGHDAPAPGAISSDYSNTLPATNYASSRFRDRRGPGSDGHIRRPPWLRTMPEQDYEALMQKRSLHGLVLTMSTESMQAASSRDLWMRSFIVLLAGVSVVGSGLAWRNIAKTSDLQIRLVRASELNTHLKEMNLAAAGLAHETRNPLNIIRGLAQMISKQGGTLPEVREKSLSIINEADKVAAQLNEFINYSRPREVRRRPLPLAGVVNEVVRTLSYDLEEKQISLEVKGEPLHVEADEQLLRQAVFNLVLNAIQAVHTKGKIEVAVQRNGGAEALMEVRDDGPGVPAESRTEIFKPYFTMQKEGTGLGLAVVQQIVLAHGWEIGCLPNTPQGAVFRITHLKIAQA
jgi:signal transduction histidine kinase